MLRTEYEAKQESYEPEQLCMECGLTSPGLGCLLVTEYLNPSGCDHE